ncbi:hypothetical protein [Hominifimenecus sp. rT4P-3]|uniref:hypothetical protein n=1 Tax=Hominifimenecus sp. rT4P-3 TaxID=3242979 RepID=UPI003DA2F136
MRGQDFLDKMDLIDPAYVEAADTIPKKKKYVWVKWGAAAACLFLAILAGTFALHTDDTSSVSLGGITRKYKNVHAVIQSELAILWPWEYQTVSERYTALDFDGKTFLSRSQTLDASLLGETIGNYDAVGYDFYAEKEYRMPVEVCEINSVSRERMVAAKLDSDFYVFQCDAYIPPANFGEALDDYSLDQTLPLDNFTVYDGYTDKGHYRLEHGQDIWDILKDCRDAAFVKDDAWDVGERNHISFTVTSDALGVYKRVFCVTSDGYIQTNIFDWNYVFQIGEDAAGRLISYAAENGVESVMEPYTASLAGTLAEISDGFLFVDDSILCSNPADGMVFKIPTDDLRISRCIDFGNIGVGDIIVVDFTGDIDTTAGNVVEGAYSLSEGILSDDGVLVPE